MKIYTQLKCGIRKNILWLILRFIYGIFNVEKRYTDEFTKYCSRLSKRLPGKC